MKNRSLLIIPLLSLFYFVQSIGHAGTPPALQSSSVVPLSSGSVQSDAKGRESEVMLANLVAEMKLAIESIEADLESNMANSAQEKASKMFDDAKTKLGIDPRYKIQTAIPIDVKLMSADFDLLNSSDQAKVVEGVRSFRGGMLLETIKLYKKTGLLYARASYLKYLSGESKVPRTSKKVLHPEDRNKIIADLAKATLIPLIIEGKDSEKMIIFESNVIDSDATYEFNRQIRKFLEESAALNLTADNFKAYQNQAIATLKMRGQPKAEPRSIGPTYESIYTSRDFAVCRELQMGKTFLSSRYAEEISQKCVTTIKNGFSKFTSAAFKICFSSMVAKSDVVYHDVESAVNTCVEQMR